MANVCNSEMQLGFYRRLNASSGLRKTSEPFSESYYCWEPIRVHQLKRERKGVNLTRMGWGEVVLKLVPISSLL